MRKTLKWLGISVLGLLMLLGGLLLAVYFSLRSPAVVARLLPEASALLEQQAGMSISARRGSIDLLRGASFDDLVLAWHDPVLGTVDVELQTLRLSYDLSGITNSSLRVDKLDIDGLSAKAELDVSATDAQGDSAPSASATPDLAALFDLLRQPPLNIEIDDIRIRNSQLDVKLTTDGQTLHYATDIAARLKSAWTSAGISFATELTMGAANEARLQLSGDDAQAIKLLANPRMSSDISLRLSPNDRGWHLRMAPANAAIHLNEVALTLATPDQTRIALKSFSLAANAAEIDKQTSSPDPLNLLPITIDTDVFSEIDDIKVTTEGDELNADANVDRIAVRLQSQAATGKPERPDLPMADWLLQQLTVNLDASIRAITSRVNQGDLPMLAELSEADFGIDLDVHASETSRTWPLTTTAKAHLDFAGLHLEGEPIADVTTNIAGHQRIDLNLSNLSLSLEQPLSDLLITLKQRAGFPDVQVSMADANIDAPALLLESDVKIESTGVNGDALPPVQWGAVIDLNADKLALQQADTMSLDLAPTLVTRTSGRIEDFSKPLEALIASLDLDYRLLDIEVEMQSSDATTLISADQQRVTASAQLQDNVVTLNSEQQLTQAVLPELTQPIDTLATINFASDLAATRPQGSLHVALNEQSLLDFSFSGKNDNEQFKLTHELAAKVTMALCKLLPALEFLNMVGDLTLTGTGETDVSHGARDLRSADWTKLTEWPASARGNIQLTQTAPPELPDGVQLARPIRISYMGNAASRYSAKLQLDVPSLQMAPLLSPLDTTVHLAADSVWPPATVNAALQLAIADRDAIQLKLRASDGNKRLDTKADIDLAIDPGWARYIQLPVDLNEFGAVNLETSLDLALTHPFTSALSIDPAKYESFDVSAIVDTRVKQNRKRPGKSLRLHRSSRLRQALKWSANGLAANTQLDIGHIAWADLFQGENLAIDIKASGGPGLAPTAGSARIAMTADSLLLPGNEDTPDRELATPISPMTLTASARLLGTGSDQLRIDKFNLNVGDGMLQTDITGDAQLDGSRAELAGNILFLPGDQVLLSPAISGAGEMSVPWRASLFDAQQVSLRGNFTFKDFDLIIGESLSLVGLDGQLPLEEELELTDEGDVRFSYLLATDPFQRVDFDRIQPYLDQRAALRINTISAAGQNLGPMQANVSLQQNLLRLPRFSLDLLSGHLSGQMYFDATPQAWKTGVMGRLTQIDLRQLLPADSPLRNGEYAPVSGRAALELDLAQLRLEGRVDLTDVSRVQLMQVLDIVDPSHSDEQLAVARTGLRLAHPKRVTLDMRNSLLDMEVELSALGTPIRIYGLPLSPLLQRFAGEGIAAIRDLPLRQ